MEHITVKKIVTHFEENCILVDNQHDFPSSRSYESQLVITTQDIAKYIDTKEVTQVDAAILDFSKAFDKVLHQQHINKL